MAGEAVETSADVVDELGGETLRQLDGFPDLLWAPRVDVLRQCVDLGLGETECLAHVLEHRPGPVGDHVGDHRCSFSAVAPVAVLDHLLAPLGFEVDVDVGGTAPLLRQEPLEGKMETDRVDPGEPDAAAHRRVGARTADLAVDVPRPRKGDDVPGDEEEPGESQLGDDVELVIESGHRGGVDAARAIARVHVPRPFEDEMPQILVLRRERTRHREVGELGCEQIEIEGELRTQLGRPLHGTRIAGEPADHLLRRLQVSLVGRRPEPVCEVEVPPPRDRSEHFRQIGVGANRVVDVVRRNRRYLQPHPDLGNEVVAGIVARHPVMPELEEETIRKDLPEP